MLLPDMYALFCSLDFLNVNGATSNDLLHISDDSSGSASPHVTPIRLGLSRTNPPLPPEHGVVIGRRIGRATVAARQSGTDVVSASDGSEE